MNIMFRSLAILIFIHIAALSAFSQIEMPEKLRLPDAPEDSLPSYMRPVTAVGSPDSLSRSGLSTDFMLRKFESTLKSSFYDQSRFPAITSVDIGAPNFVGFNLWDGAQLGVSGSTTSFPGMMGIESGSISFTQQLGNLTVTAYGTASKFGYFRGLQTSYGFGGSVTYRINQRWFITAFGSYSTPLHPMTMGMAGYMNAPNFGGYASYEINEHWGINVGAQATRSLVTNRWEAQPIVEPYYKINGKAAIGIDVGGILYNAIRSYNENRQGYRANPTIGPPVGGPPPVAPRPDK